MITKIRTVLAGMVVALSMPLMSNAATITDMDEFLELGAVIDSFASASLSEVPSPTGGKPLKLVDMAIESAWQLAAASPGFGGGELNHMMFPGQMIDERVNCRLTYVSFAERRDVDLRDMLAERIADQS